MHHSTAGARSIRTRLTAGLALFSVVASLGWLAAPAVAVGAEPGDPSLIWTTELYRESGYGFNFGQAIAFDGDTMVVAAHTGDDNYRNTCGRGLAYVYERVNALEWREVAQLKFSEPIHCYSEDVAFDVAIHGDWIALASPLVDVLLPDADPVDPTPEDYNQLQGAVLMFHKPATGWADATETMMLTEYDGSRHGTIPGDMWDTYGVDVAFDGDELFVGAPNYDFPGATDAGAVFVYREWLGGWEREAMLTNSTVDQPHFGASVSASEGALAVGSNDINYGAGYGERPLRVYERPVDGWADSTQPSASFQVPGLLGYKAVIDGPTMVVASPFTWRIFVVERGAGGWNGALQASAELDFPVIDYDRFSRLPHSWALDGETIAVGMGSAEEDAGQVFVYHRPADGWGEPGAGDIAEPDETLFSPDPVRNPGGVIGGDEFGSAVAIDGGILAVGAHYRNHMTFDTHEDSGDVGSVFMFESTTDHDVPQSTITVDPAAPGGLDGWYDETPTMSVQSADVGSGVAETRCALVEGGTFPTYDSLPDAPCAFMGGADVPDGEWLMFAASVDTAGNRSAVVGTTIKVDTMDPTPVIQLDPAEPTAGDGAWVPPFAVKLASLEDEHTSASGWCTLDPAVAPTTYEELTTLPFCGQDFWSSDGRIYTTDETHTIYMAAIDRAGNTSDVISASYRVVTRPRVTISLSSTAAPTAGWYRTPVRVTVAGTSANDQPAPETRCVLDPAVPPLDFVNLPASCPYLGGALVSASGTHTVYAGSHDAGGWSPIGSATFKIDATPPTLTCDGTGPAQFVIGASEGTLTATVTDGASGPAAPTATLDLTDADLATAGVRTATLRALDVAGNEGTVACSYRVGYGIEVVSPTPGATYKAGATVPLTFRLVDSDGEPIADATAAALLPARKTGTFRLFISLDNSAIRGCPTYSATADLFSFSVKTPKSRSAVGIHDIGIEVRAADGRTVISFVRVAFQLT
jgi:hypothetical protein